MQEFEYIPAGPPDEHDWEYRRRKYDSYWASCINEKGSTTNDHVDGLKLELERCFCTGAWIACIFLSAAIVEVHLSFLDKWNKSKINNYIGELNFIQDWSWLRNRRNLLIHGGNRNSPNRFSTEEYRRQRDEYSEAL